MNVSFLNDTATTEIYTLSLHDALPILTVGQNIKATYSFADPSTGKLQHQSRSFVISAIMQPSGNSYIDRSVIINLPTGNSLLDRKSTRLNSSHMSISYAVFCLKKKTK